MRYVSDDGYWTVEPVRPVRDRGGRAYLLGTPRRRAGMAKVRGPSNATTGELLRELVLDPTRNYQPTGRSPGPTKHKTRTP